MSQHDFSRSKYLVAFTLLAALAGCSSSNRTSFDPTGKHKMAEIGQMLITLKESNSPPPSSLDDFGRVEPMVPLSAAELRSGEIVFFWGKGLSSATKVLAHEKKAATEGGWVLMTDGSVKQMSADEFKSAPKAK